MNNNSPLVSVIIPTYNREKTIERAINSVLAQEFSNIEIVIIDDGSTDNTVQVINRLKDPHISYHKNTYNMGAAASRNYGVEIAKGDYIAFQDSDDEWLPQKLTKQMERLVQCGEDVLVYCPFLQCEGERCFQIPSCGISKSQLEGDIYQTLLHQNTIGTPTMVMKKNFFLKIGGFDTKMAAMEDWDFAVRASKLGEIVYIDQPLVKAYYSENSVNQNHKNIIDASVRIYKKNINCVEKKEDCCALLQIAFEHMVYCTDDYMCNVVPEIISTETEYLLMLNSYRKLENWKRKYKGILWVEQNINSYVDHIYDNIVIYGGGMIGQELVRKLRYYNKEVSCIIDKNKVYVEGIETISPTEYKMEKKEQLCIITVPDLCGETENKMKEIFKGTIINICR